MKSLLAIVFFCFYLNTVFAEQPAFDIDFEQVFISNAPLVHSFAWAHSGNKWLIIGGRINGMHGLFTVGTAFEPKYENKYVWVIDPITNQVWSANLFSSLTVQQADPLRSTNMQFYQDGDKLIMAGGYGLDSLKDSLVTFPVLSVIDVGATIQAVINNTGLSQHIRQVSDERMRICGAELTRLGGYYFIPGGHNFWGQYSFTVNNQIYTNSIRKFQIQDNGTSVSIVNYSAIIDTVNLHRRDYNLVPSILNNGSMGLTLYGGVFLYDVNLPFRNPIYITENGYSSDMSFQQQMIQYTSAHFEVYDSAARNMQTTFLGGTSLYYYDQNTHQLVMDQLVPFVKDVSTLSRNNEQSSSEFVHPYHFQSYIGTNAVFIPDTSVPQYSNQVIKLNQLTGRTFIGYMFGGIQGTAPNLGPSTASDKIYKVFITRNSIGIHQVGTEIPDEFWISQNYPNPFNPQTRIEFMIPFSSFVNITLYDIMGREVSLIVNKYFKAGHYSVDYNAAALTSGLYFYRLSSENYHMTRKMIVLK